MTRATIVPDTDVPPGEEPAARCPYCDRPFRTERAGALHVGEVHAGAVSDAEREAYEAALDDESDELWVYHLKVVAAITLTYAAFVVGFQVMVGMGG